eukprot:3445410-Pleurochrysis_carterae.AAC.1
MANSATLPPSLPFARAPNASAANVASIAAAAVAAKPAATPYEPAVASLPVNRSEALSNVGGDEKILRRLFEKFLTRATSHMAIIEQKFDKHEWEALKREAHALKGPSDSIGASTLKQYLDALKTAAGEVATHPKRQCADARAHARARTHAHARTRTRAHAHDTHTPTPSPLPAPSAKPTPPFTPPIAPSSMARVATHAPDRSDATAHGRTIDSHAPTFALSLFRMHASHVHALRAIAQTGTRRSGAHPFVRCAC